MFKQNGDYQLKITFILKKTKDDQKSVNRTSHINVLTWKSKVNRTIQCQISFDLNTSLYDHEYAWITLKGQRKMPNDAYILNISLNSWSIGKKENKYLRWMLL